MHEIICNYMWDVTTKLISTFNEGIQRNLDFLEKVLNKGWQSGKFDNVPPFSAKSGFSEVYFFSQNKKDRYNEHVGWMWLEKCHSETEFEPAILFLKQKKWKFLPGFEPGTAKRLQFIVHHSTTEPGILHFINLNF